MTWMFCLVAGHHSGWTAQARGSRQTGSSELVLLEQWLVYQSLAGSCAAGTGGYRHWLAGHQYAGLPYTGPQVGPLLLVVLG